MATPAQHARRLGPLAALAAVVLALFGLAQTAPGLDAREALGLAEPPERFTELGFEDPHGLPDIVTRPLRADLAFEIHNQEGEPRRYDWVAELRTGDRVERLAAGTATVPDGGGTLVRREVTLPCGPRPGASTVTVRLERPARQIHFDVECLPEDA